MQPPAKRSLRLLPDRTGIQQHQVRLLIIARCAKSILVQYGSYDLTIGKIHGAAITLYIEFLLVSARIRQNRSISLPLAGLIMTCSAHSIKHLLPCILGGKDT